MGKQDDKYQQLKNKLQQQSTSEQYVDYHLMTNGLVRFKDKIYLLKNNNLKKIILKEFHALSHIQVT